LIGGSYYGRQEPKEQGKEEEEGGKESDYSNIFLNRDSEQA